ncbi:S8 family serine peptidase [Lysobacter niabensis]|uniref:S8 family peptidase n=1 Tax=Agrilutibacter niabensis TaxID=380628 RepID=UPI0036109F26
MSRLSCAIAMALGSVVCVSSAQAATYVVQAKNLSFDTQFARKIEAAGGTITRTLPKIGVAFVESSDTAFRSRAAKVQGVRSVVPDVAFQAELPEAVDEISEDFVNPPGAAGENDFLFNLQWGHAAIDAAGAWNAGYRGAGVRVAVLDSGIRCNHPDLASNLLAADSISFVPTEPSYCNTSGSSHGTHTSGTILGADNGTGIIGVAPEAKLIAVKVLSAATGGGSFEGIIAGIVHAADHGADVINMSLGVRGGLEVGGKDTAELINATKRAVAYARKQNAITIVSAGNDGRDLDHDSGVSVCDTDGTCFRANLRAFPAQVPGVVSVSALAPEGWALNSSVSLDPLASYSNYGQSAIGFGAPGGDARLPGTANCVVSGIGAPCWVFDMVLSSTLTGWGWSAGTSMAAPHVSGVAALIVGKHGGELAPSEVERILRASADDLGKPGNDDAYGAGRVNAAKAMQY